MMPQVEALSYIAEYMSLLVTFFMTFLLTFSYYEPYNETKEVTTLVRIKILYDCYRFYKIKKDVWTVSTNQTTIEYYIISILFGGLVKQNCWNENSMKEIVWTFVPSLMIIAIWLLILVNQKEPYSFQLL